MCVQNHHYSLKSPFQSFQVLIGLLFQSVPKALALICFSLSCGALTMICALLVAISLTRIFILVKVTRKNLRHPHQEYFSSADHVSQPESWADFPPGICLPGHRLLFLQLCLGFLLPENRYGWASTKKNLHSKFFGSLDDIFSVKDDDSFRLHHVLVVCRNCQRIIFMFQT